MAGHSLLNSQSKKSNNMRVQIKKSVDEIFETLKTNYPEAKLSGKNLFLKKGKSQFHIKHLENNDYNIDAVPAPILIILAYMPGIIVMLVLGNMNVGIIPQFLGTVLTIGILVFVVKTYTKISKSNQISELIKELKNFDNQK